MCVFACGSVQDCNFRIWTFFPWTFVPRDQFFQGDQIYCDISKRLFQDFFYCDISVCLFQDFYELIFSWVFCDLILIQEYRCITIHWLSNGSTSVQSLLHASALELGCPPLALQAGDFLTGLLLSLSLNIRIHVLTEIIEFLVHTLDSYKYVF